MLDGALALALPLKLGQSLNIQSLPQSSSNRISWKSRTKNNEVWLEVEMDLAFKISQTSDTKMAERLVQLFRFIASKKPELFQQGYAFETQLEFERNWGLGSSSTLINNLAQWAELDAFELSAASFGGSGYDIACASQNQPILYQNKPRTIEAVDFDPDFKHELFFIFLGQKQNSRDGIKRYRERFSKASPLSAQISAFTKAMLDAKDLETFESIVEDHEQMVSTALDLQRVQSRLFPDFPGKIKSLGAWGGDFVLATCAEGEKFARNYFNQNGFDVFFTYNDLVLIKK